jgi:4-amino-4-deoxy-L-arabinose transferase-like glycosyltransferase
VCTPTGDRIRATLPVVLALLITAYGGVLRLNVITSRYGPIQRPAWARVLGDRVAPIARHLEPGMYAWPAEEHPYVGGDPITYLKFAREMRSFYQAHVREPVFLAITRASLWLLDGQDVGISFASAAMSTAGIFATYLLGSAAFSRVVGLLAALGLAIDYHAISWSADGWRDDTFTTIFILTAWAFVKLLNQPRLSNAVLSGVLSGAACLTRITAISWIAPALLLTVMRGRDRERRPLVMGALAAAIAALLVAPYLINCARVTGDPLIAINAHTRYYRAGEGLDYSSPQSALDYIRGKLSRRPLYQADTVVTGIFVWPFQNKWSGYNLWLPHLTDILKWCAVAGLLLFLTSPNGRLLLVLLLSSLVPYAFTWNIAGGGEWRFTMHVYPIYLIAAASVPVWVSRTAWSLHLEHERPAVRSSRTWFAVAAVLGAAVLARSAYMRLPYYVQREALTRGEPVTIAAGDRDEIFYTKQWLPPTTEGTVTARVVVGERAVIELPLPERRSYRLTIRMDGVTPETPRTVAVLLNGRLLRRLGLDWDPDRVGTYSVDVDPDFVRPGRAVLQLVAERAIPARDAGPRYTWIAPDTPVSLRVWYVRIHPL